MVRHLVCLFPSENPELQTQGLKDSIKFILEIVRQEAEIVGAERVVLGGISMGCAAGMAALLCGGVRLGGFLWFCGWLPGGDGIEGVVGRLNGVRDVVREIRGVFGVEAGNLVVVDEERVGSQEGSMLATPVFLAHCKDDEVVPIGNGEKKCRTLEKLGMAVTWKEYEDGGHWINEPQGVDDIVAFLREHALGSQIPLLRTLRN